MKVLAFLLVQFLLPISISAFFFNWHFGGVTDINKNEKICPPLRGENVKHFRRVVSFGTVQPDNYVQKGILTNGRFPAQPIVCHQRDTIIVEVENNLPEPFTLHFHGILQKGTVRSDGVPYITQNPIMPNSTYYYIMNIGEQSGTFIYHAHTALHIVWVFAPLIILEKEGRKPLKTYSGYHYDEERTLTISQCWHESIQSMHDGLLAAPFQDIPDTASILINGYSYGNWSSNNGNSKGFTIIHVEAEKCYLFRVISVSSDSAVQFHIEDHKGHVVEADGVVTNPVETAHLNINSAQRYGYIVCMNRPVNNYKIRARMMPGPGPNNGVAILHYKGAPNPEPLRKNLPSDAMPKEIKDEPFWLKEELFPSPYYPQPDIVYPVPKTVDKEIIISAFQKTTADGSKHFEINGAFNPTPKVTLIDMIQKDYLRVSRTSPAIFDLPIGNNVQIVFINHVGSDGICEQHPWHLHGHTFYIVGDGADNYRTGREGMYIQKKIEYLHKHHQPMNFQFRDVLTLFPNQTTTPTPGSACGWIAIRFVANNPGIWIAHCHLTAHLIMGKRIELHEHSKSDPFLQDQCYYNGHYEKPY